MSLIPNKLARLLAPLVLLSSLSAQAAWPEKTITLIVPYPPGGAADTVGRIYADALSESLKQPVVVENKPGAGTAIAADLVANSRPDGYTLSLVPTGQFTVLPHIAKIKFDPFKSFEPVSLLAYTGVVIAANAQLPVKDFKDFIAQAKAAPGKFSYSSSGSGTIIHLAGEYLRLKTGVNLLHVPFKGSAPAVTAVLGGDVNLAVDTLTVLAPQIKGGKLKGLAIASAERSPVLPDVPTVAELGYPGFEVRSWFGLVAAAKTPKEILVRLNAEIAKAAASQSVKYKLTAQGLDAWPSTPAQFTQQIRTDYDKYGQVVRESGATFD